MDNYDSNELEGKWIEAPCNTTGRVACVTGQTEGAGRILMLRYPCCLPRFVAEQVPPDGWVKGAARKPCPSSLDQDTHCSIVRRMTHILVGLAHVMTAPGHGSGTLGFRATCHEWPTE